MQRSKSQIDIMHPKVCFQLITSRQNGFRKKDIDDEWSIRTIEFNQVWNELN